MTRSRWVGQTESQPKWGKKTELKNPTEMCRRPLQWHLTSPACTRGRFTCCVFSLSRSVSIYLRPFALSLCSLHLQVKWALIKEICPLPSARLPHSLTVRSFVFRQQSVTEAKQTRNSILLANRARCLECRESMKTRTLFWYLSHIYK